MQLLSQIQGRTKIPSSPNYKRNYVQERLAESPARKKERALRNKARRQMAKKVGKAALKGKDVDHKKPLSTGGTGALTNLRLLSAHSNRSYARTSSGAIDKKKYKK